MSYLFSFSLFQTFFPTHRWLSFSSSQPFLLHASSFFCILAYIRFNSSPFIIINSLNIFIFHFVLLSSWRKKSVQKINMKVNVRILLWRKCTQDMDFREQKRVNFSTIKERTRMTLVGFDFFDFVRR